MKAGWVASMALCFMAVALMSCSTPKAALDLNMSGRIHWPGGKEKPRIRYLWSLMRVAGGEGGTVSRVIFGDPMHGAGEVDSDILVHPHGVYFDSSDRLYIADMGAARVVVVDMNTMESFFISETGDVRLYSPIGVVVGPDGRIYVSDTGLKRVGIYDRDGDFLHFIEGGFERPTGLALDSERGVLYVSDTWRHIIYKYSLDGELLGSFGGRGSGEGQFNYPTHLAVGPGGEIYVSDTLNFRIQTLSPEGEYIGEFGIPGDTYKAFDKIKGIAVDSMGHIYVTDSVQDMVKIYDRQGRLLLYFGQRGRFYGDFSHPAGIHIDADDNIYVVDSLNRRVQAFKFLGGD